MVPPAPATFSTIHRLARLFAMDCEMRRATVSVRPPAAKGTTIVMVRVG
jgi:hypothetical protein